MTATVYYLQRDLILATNPLKLTQQYEVVGTVTDLGSPMEATVRVYGHASGQLIAETTSDAADGTYSVSMADQIEVDVVAVDLDDNSKRPKIHGPVMPVTVD